MRALFSVLLQGPVASHGSVCNAVLSQQVALTIGLGGEEGVAVGTGERFLTWGRDKRKRGGGEGGGYN